MEAQFSHKDVLMPPVQGGPGCPQICRASWDNSFHLASGVGDGPACENTLSCRVSLTENCEAGGERGCVDSCK